MKQNVAVIDAGYGDSGKGRTVDYFAKTLDNPLVIRFNGGAQAGHTVWLDENISHVFHTFGSGTFRGADTYLYKHVLFDPHNANIEYNALAKLGYHPNLIIDRKCRIVTIFDIFFNQLKETLKGNGSCGMGINETIDRNELIPFVYNDIYSVVTRDDSLQNILYKIQMYYAEKIVNLCGFTAIPESLKEFADSIFNPDFIQYTYAEQLLKVINYFKVEQQSYLKEYDQSLSKLFESHSLIFESAQGLMLDEYYGNFPHVTRSRTGSHNVIDFCREYNITVDTVYYVNRAYSTRHGYDPTYKSEDISKVFNVVDTTNIHNTWQGTMKYNYLNIFKVMEAIRYDQNLKLSNDVVLVFTCLDQLINENHWVIHTGLDYYVTSRKTFQNHFPKWYKFMFFDSKIN